MYVLRCALAGAAFSTGAVIGVAVTWTLVQARQDQKHMVEYWQKRRLEDATAAHPRQAPMAGLGAGWQLDSLAGTDH